MKRRKSKKKFIPGTLVTVIGTSYVFTSLGMKSEKELYTINGFDIKTGVPVTVCSGEARLATKKECVRYWKCIKDFSVKRLYDEF